MNCDLYLYVFKFCTFETLLQLRLVCKLFRECANNSNIYIMLLVSDTLTCLQLLSKIPQRDTVIINMTKYNNVAFFIKMARAGMLVSTHNTIFKRLRQDKAMELLLAVLDKHYYISFMKIVRNIQFSDETVLNAVIVLTKMKKYHYVRALRIRYKHLDF